MGETGEGGGRWVRRERVSETREVVRGGEVGETRGGRWDRGGG